MRAALKVQTHTCKSWKASFLCLQGFKALQKQLDSVQISKLPVRLSFLMNFCCFRVKGEGSYLIGNDRALSEDAVA
ncbi:hypothetical protein LS77_009715 [Helicobacter bilis]|uniref:Uncharacterized protein n=1 Tax=Helicobacter bilis TaxID=37372 RepID=A0A6D2C4J4_9HELI|nr:hypothetical protein [Helicobacter bilis]TLE02964.1 hypothetical protein LS77_009715 [Helicobacter bilis]TLE03742.1 hypothetical protein LS76_009785 [Helicobacter bilis]